jgi:lipid-A-disaccharide synthase
MEDTFYHSLLPETDNSLLLTRDTYSVLRQADVAIVNSGTATLETALFGCPLVAVYHIAASRFFGKHVVDLFKHYIFHDGYFTLVNILSGKEVIKELIAEQFTVENITKEATRLIDDTDYRISQIAGLQQLSAILGGNCAADTAAETILKTCV